MNEIDDLQKENEVLRASRVFWSFSERQLIEKGDLEGMKARALQIEEYLKGVHDRRDAAEAALATARADLETWQRRVTEWQRALQENWSEPVSSHEFMPADIATLVSREREEAAAAQKDLQNWEDFHAKTLSRARTIAMEEAARHVEANWELTDGTDDANDIRALAPLPSSLVLVEQVELRSLLAMFPCVECGEQGRRHFTTEGDGPFWLCDSTDADHSMPDRYAGDDETRPLDVLLKSFQPEVTK